jgi:hypothetical protein
MRHPIADERASFPKSGPDFPQRFFAIHEFCFAGAHSGTPLADFI